MLTLATNIHLSANMALTRGRVAGRDVSSRKLTICNLNIEFTTAYQCRLSVKLSLFILKWQIYLCSSLFKFNVGIFRKLLFVSCKIIIRLLKNEQMEFLFCRIHLWNVIREMFCSFLWYKDKKRWSINPYRPCNK